MQLKFPVAETQALAVEYLLNGRPLDMVREARIETLYAQEVRLRGWFTKTELVETFRWKNPRLAKRVEINDDVFIQEVTRTALSTTDERLRIEVLTLLKGVSWSMASVVLHFCHHEPYPILDALELWSLGMDGSRSYHFDTWLEYTHVCREAAQQAGVSMRMLDRALTRYAILNKRLRISADAA